MPSMTITWFTHLDERVCPICAPLHGRKWVLQAGRDVFPSRLEAEGRPVWDMFMNTPMTHGLLTYNCRCTLSYDVDVSDVLRLVENLQSVA